MLENETRQISNYDKNMKTKLYNQDGSLCSEAQFLISLKPGDMSMREWKKVLKEFKSRLSTEDVKTFERLRQREQERRWENKYPEKVK